MKRIISTAVLLALMTSIAEADYPYTQVSGTVSVVNDAVSLNALLGQSVCVTEVSGTFVGTITLEGQANGNWTTLNSTPVGANSSLSSITAPGTYSADCSALTGFRARLSAVTSGSATVLVNAAQGVSRNDFQNVTIPGTVNVTASTPLPVSISSPLPLPVYAPSPLPVTMSTPAPYSFFQTPITGTSAYVVKGSAGTFFGMSNISTTAMPQRTTCYDNATVASGTILQLTQLSQNSQLLLTPNGIPFANGLTCANSGNLSGNGIQILYK